MKQYLPLLLALASSLQAGDKHTDLDTEKAAPSGTAIHIVFDDSGSMNETNKIGQAKAAFSAWIASIPEESKVSLTTLNRGEIVKLAPHNKAEVTAKVENLTAAGGTPLTKTFTAVAQKIKARQENITPYERHILVIFTDGEDTDYDKPTVQQALEKLRRLDIESVGIGFHGQGDYMKGHATKYFDAHNTQELLEALHQVASEIDQQSEVVLSPEIEAAMEAQTPAKKPSPTQSENTADPKPPEPNGNNAAIIALTSGAITILILIFLASCLS